MENPNCMVHKGSFELTTHVHSKINYIYLILGLVEGLNRKNVKRVVVLRAMSWRPCMWHSG